MLSESVIFTENDEKVSGTFDEIRTLKFQWIFRIWSDQVYFWSKMIENTRKYTVLWDDIIRKFIFRSKNTFFHKNYPKLKIVKSFEILTF